MAPTTNRLAPTIAPHFSTLPAMWLARSHPEVSRSLTLPFLPVPWPFSGFTRRPPRGIAASQSPSVGVLHCALATRRLARNAVADDVRADQVVPAARLAHLELVDADLAVLVRHRLD